MRSNVSRPPSTITGPSKHRIPSRRGNRISLAPHPDSPDQTDVGAVRAWLKERPRPWAVDLFCGAGGLSLGLEEAGLAVVVGADSNRGCTETHAANIPGLTWTGDLSDPAQFLTQLDEWGIDHVDVLAGGPPCQPFSRAGTSKIGDLVRRGDRPARDSRADLWRSFFSVVDRLNPSVVVFENVPDFASAQGGALLIALIDELRSRHYEVVVDVLQAWRYGVPQHRSRLFVVGVAGGADFRWPEPRGRRPNVGQAIADLPVVGADVRDEVQPYSGRPTTKLARVLRRGMTRGEGSFVRDHVTRPVRADDEEIYRLMKPGGTYLDVPEHLRRYRSDIFDDKYVRLSFEGLSRTITAHIAKDGYWYIHPREHRTLSIREAARIQTFPDRFRFAGYPTARYRQIGNAVPPLLASAIGESVISALGTVSEGSADLRARTVPESSFRDDLLAWFSTNRRDFPWRQTGLNPWETLMLEMCLHRTRADQVSQVAERILHLGGTPRQFIENFEALRSTLSTLGLHWRAEKLLEAARHIEERYAGRVPDNWQELVTIPGVGDYIASAVLCFAFGQHAVLVDTNTERIARRVLGEEGERSRWRRRLALHDLAGPRGSSPEWNQALLDLGALLCTARVARCEQCPVRAHCRTGATSL